MSKSRMQRSLIPAAAVVFAILAMGCQGETLHNAGLQSPYTQMVPADGYWLVDTTLSFSYTPLDPTTLVPASVELVQNTTDQLAEEDTSLKVRPRKTAWGLPWDRHALVIRMNDILERNGIESEEARIKMIAHAVVASGWRQNVWNYNAWGVQLGSWDGPYYEMFTTEIDDNGKEIEVPDAKWRAFGNWRDSIKDFENRIGPDSQRPSYRQAYKQLLSQQRGSCAKYWRALGEGNYYTAHQFTPGKFAALCWAVRQTLDS